MGRVTLDIDEAVVRDGLAYAQSHGTTLDQLVADLIQEKVQKNSGDKLEAMYELGRKLDHASDGKRLSRDEIYDRH